MKTEKFIKDYLIELKTAATNIRQEDINLALTLLYNAWKDGKQVFVAGNGGSASTATHFTCDLAKFTAVEDKQRFKAICLNDNIPLVSALTNDLGWENVYYEQLRNIMNSGDLLVVISVHGGSGADKAGIWSQNILKAAEYVQNNGGKVIGLAGFDGGALKQMADACIVAPVNSTPQVEGFHVVLTHLLCAALRQAITETGST
ncbi:MAG: SIS domain-containing protein [Candidatus Bathyarchaeota archaeon]|nr:SIS domain-containing protein [Candidatus Bathyarchaeota archaeon]